VRKILFPATLVVALAITAAFAATAGAKDGAKVAEPGAGLPEPSDLKKVRSIGSDTAPTEAGKLEGGPAALAFSADGKLLAVGAVTGAVSIIESGEGGSSGWRRVGEHLGSVSGVAFIARPIGLNVVSTGDDEMLRVSVLGGDLSVVTSTSRALGLGPLTALAVLDANPQAPRLAIGSGRGTIAIVRLGDTLTIERTIERHEGAIVAIVALGGNRFASAGWDGTVKLSDASTGKELRSAKVCPIELTTLAATADGKSLAVGSWKKGVLILDASSLKTLATLEPHQGGAVSVLLVGPAKTGIDKARLVSASIADETVAVSEVLGARAELRPARRARIRACPSGIAASPDGTRLAVGVNDGSVTIYELETQAAIK
jgi:WD40 repeat protein